MADVLVIGCGLMGTSIGLALRDTRDVVLQDRAPDVTAEAARLGAGRVWDGKEGAALAIVAVPPAVTGLELKRLQDRDVAQTLTHISSVQSYVQDEVEALGCDVSRIVGGHPLAGRETSGPGAAMASLFAGRPWAVCPHPEATPAAVADVWKLAQDCGAVPLRMDAETHDASVGLVSHLPQVAASALAGRLAALGPEGPLPADGREQAPELRLAGPGLVDTTRLAASDPALWVDILRLNAKHVAGPLEALIADLSALLVALHELEQQPRGHAAAVGAVETFLQRGRSGRALVPVKRGDVDLAFAAVRVGVPDRPGRLAALLAAAGDLGVNVEDVHVEHLPGRPSGVIELVVHAADALALADGLRASEWDVLG